MEKDLYGDYTPMPHRRVVLTHTGRELSVRIHDTTDGAGKQDATDGTAGDDASDSYGDDIKTMFDVKKDNDISNYLDCDHIKDEFLQHFKRGDLNEEDRKTIQSIVDGENKIYNVWRSEKTPLQIASEKGCFQMVSLLKGAADINVQKDIYCNPAIEAIFPQEVGKMFAKANPAYLCLKEKDPIIAALNWPSEFKKVVRRTDTLSILQVRYKDCERKLTQFTEEILNCCLTPEEVKTLLNGKDHGNGDFFLYDTLQLADDAVRLRGTGILAHRKTQLELHWRWFDGVPKFTRRGGDSWFWFFLSYFCFWFFYGILCPVLPMVYALPYSCIRELISSPQGKFFAEQFFVIFFLVGLFVYEVLDYHHPVVFSFLLSWTIGSFFSELIQLNTKGRKRYFDGIWNFLDWLVLFSFAAGIVVRDYFATTGSPFLLFLEKLPAVTMVCALLRFMQNFYLSKLVGKMFLIFIEMKTEVFRFLVIFGYVVLAFACSFYFLYYDVNKGILTPFLNFQTSLLHLTMKVFSETSKLEYMQLLNQNITVGGAQRNGTVMMDASAIYDLAGFTLYTVFLTMAILILLKLCVAMMTNKYSILQENIEKLWYLKRSEIWLDYIRQKIIFPPPYNLLEIFIRILVEIKRHFQQHGKGKTDDKANEKETKVGDVPLESVGTGTQATEEKTKVSDPLLEKKRTGDQATEEETKVSDPQLVQERTDDSDTADTKMQKEASPNVFKPSYEQLIKILKARYYKFHGCKNCKIHGLMKEG